MSQLNQLRWRCRRGTLELDELLSRYLETRYPIADESEQQAFAEMLALEDDRLLAYLLGDAVPEQPDMARVVFAVRDMRRLG